MIEAPDLSLAALAPLLFVFGAACIGVLVEAFWPRASRHPVQVAVALVGTLGALVCTLLLRRHATRSPPPVRWPSTARACSCRRRSPGSARWRSCCSPSGRWTRRARRSSPRPPSPPAARATASCSPCERVQTEVYPLATFAIGGMMLFVTANDLLIMFVALEVLSLPLYLISGMARRRRLLSQEAAVKYFLLGAFASAFFLYGLALVYGATGSVRLRRHPARPSLAEGTDVLLVLGLALLVVGLLFKASVAPFHTWTPDVYQGAPTR